MTVGATDRPLDNGPDQPLAHCRWSAKGSLWLTSLRLIFVADHADPGSGLRAFDIPLAYITADRFNQPIFVCNNLTGAARAAGRCGTPVS